MGTRTHRQTGFLVPVSSRVRTHVYARARSRSIPINPIEDAIRIIPSPSTAAKSQGATTVRIDIDALIGGSIGRWPDETIPPTGGFSPILDQP
jgi:hypothetical protein